MAQIQIIVGARPQFIKAAILIRALNEHGFRNVDLVHTGQHYDRNMSGIFFEELSIPMPSLNLEVGSGSHGAMTARMLELIEDRLLRTIPDMVIIFGDTNTTLAGALAAVKLHIPIAHVEAGLRSFNRRMPEEINRVLSDHSSSLLFAPTRTAVDNLRHEGFSNFASDGRLILPDQIEDLPADLPVVVNSGDVMFDAVLAYADKAVKGSTVLKRLGLSEGKYVLASIHRAENTDDPHRLSALFKGLTIIARQLPVVIPLHPRTAAHLKQDGYPYSQSGLIMIEPVSYFDMITLERHSSVILTDSGGVQKEAFFFGVPCITLRDETEWLELVERKHNTLVGSDPKAISMAFDSVWGQHFTPESDIYGDGRASQTIAIMMKSFLSKSRK